MDDSFMNLGEEAILTLLWQSGASESTTVCFVISLSICYWQIRERERQGHITAESAFVIVARVQTHTSIITVSVTRLCYPFMLELMVNVRTLLTVFLHLIWKLKLEIMLRGITFLTRACGIRPITMLWVSSPIRADCACWKEGLNWSKVKVKTLIMLHNINFIF